MLHYKAFNSAICNDDVAALEQLVNAWLEQEQPYVHSMAQSSLGEHLVLSFLFEEDTTRDAQKSAAVAIANPDIFAEALRDTDLDPADELFVTLLPHAELPY